MKIQPFKRQGYYTVFDNILLDHVISSIKLSSWAVLCIIIRKTIGWQKESDAVSYSQIKDITGIKTNSTINTAITELADRGLILIQHVEGKSNFYTINREFTIDIPDERSGTSSKIELVTSSKIEQVLVQKLNTQNKGNISINNAREEEEYEDIRSASNYRDLQNEIIGACKKLNALALKEEDVKNIDILYASEVKALEIRDFYSKNGQSAWWYRQYWKGKKGQFPTTQDVIDTIEQARSFSGENGADIALQEVQEWILGSRKFGQFSSPVTVEVVREMGEYDLRNKSPTFWAIRFKETFAKYNPDN